MKKKEQIRELRAQHYTYTQIAERVGCTHQYVAAVCGKQSPYRFSVITDNCIYPNLRKWMNDNKVSRSEFVRRMGYELAQGNQQRFSNLLRGKYIPRKTYIDKMIEVTGMPYEVLFEVKTDGCK